MDKERGKIKYANIYKENTKSKIKKIVCLTYWALKESPLGEEDDNTLHNKKIRKAGNECTE